MKRSIYPAIIVVALLLFMQSCGGNNSPKTPVKKVQLDTISSKFLKNAIEGGLAEVKTSELVASHSQNKRVTFLAKMMVADHNKAGATLKKIEANNAITGNEAISAAHNQTIEELSKKAGADFDKAYLQAMIKDHENAVLLFINATQIKDSTLRVFAKKTLPVIQMHLDSARVISKDIK